MKQTTMGQPGPLSVATISALQAFFSTTGHNPSPGHWAALWDVAAAMEAMADETAPDQTMLSAIDCGVGKTQTTVTFARALAASVDHDDVGMLICVGRLAEAGDVARGLGIPSSRLAVLTSDPSINAVTDTPPDHAQVLVTTQQRIERATDGRSFASVGSFHYRGQPRRVRVWDEAWLPGVAVTLRADDILYLVGLVRPLSSELADGLTDFSVSLRAYGDGHLIDVPDLEARYGVSLHDVTAMAVGAHGSLRDDQRQIVTTLAILNGKTARVCRDQSHRVILSYRDTLPSDLSPLLVLDASGRVRQTYADMEAHRHNLVRLRPATKDYSPLTVHTWRTSGAKSGFANQGDKLAKGIADTILTKPDESWLVVVHQRGGRVGDIERTIRNHLRAHPNIALQVIRWGQHMATNAYADVANVVLAGTLFMPDSYYRALTHLTHDRPIIDGLDSRAVEQTARGEHRHVVYQAICRGRVRKSDGEKCQPMTAYVIASPRSGIPRDLQTVFPGCQVWPWNPVKRALRGNLKRAADYLKAALKDGADVIAVSEVRHALSLDPGNFRSTVSKKPEWSRMLSDLRLEVVRGARNAALLRLVSPN